MNSYSKILIVGASGSGKSTLSRHLAKSLQLTDIELDALYWQENWTPASALVFRERVANAISIHAAWVMNGNYLELKDLSWGNAQQLIWLDYSLSTVMFRVIKRSISRALKKEKLWAGNTETLKNNFFSKDSIILWAWQTYALRKKQYAEMIEDPSYRHLHVLRFKSPSELEYYLEGLKQASL
ncbi:MAG: toxin [Burkholderiales bacterium]|nr:toxin [Burkholderiales bacterium]